MAVGTRTYIQILTPRALTTRSDGEELLALWRDHLSEYYPQRYGNCEPLEHAVEAATEYRILDHWKWPLLTSRSSPSMESQVFMRKGKLLQHATWVLSLDGTHLRQDLAINFLRNAGLQLRADFGCLTILSPDEAKRGRERGIVKSLDKRGTKFNFFISSQSLQQSLPDVYWATFLGKPFLDWYGKDKLLALPSHKIDLISDNTLLIQATESMNDLKTRWADVSGVRDKCLRELCGDVQATPYEKEIRQHGRPTFTFEAPSVS